MSLLKNILFKLSAMKTPRKNLFIRILIIAAAIAVTIYFTEIWLGNVPMAHQAGLTYVDDTFIILSAASIILLWRKTK